MTLLLTVVLLAGNAFFVGAQFAMIAARRDQIEPLARRGSRAARITLHQMQHLSGMLAGSQLGIAVCSLGLGAVAEPGLAHLLEGGFEPAGLPERLLHPAAFVLALALVAYLHMVLGEMVPKNLSLAGPVRAALLLGPPIAAWVRLTRPVLVTINGLANWLLRRVGVEPKDELVSGYTADELADLIAESADEGLLDREGQQRLARALALDRTTAADLALPLAELVTVTDRTTARELEELVARTGFSRFPVRSGADLIGYVHVKDLLEIEPTDYDRPLPPRLRRPLVTVEAGRSLTDTVAVLRAAGSHLGRVLAGTTTVGAIALEDVLEELVGEVADASHPDRPGGRAAG